MKCILKSRNVKPPCYKCVYALRCNWSKLLDYYKWTYFLTLTFKDIPKSYTAINRAKQFLSYVERTVKHKIAYYVCMEFTRAGTPHFHLLLGNLEQTRYSEWTKWWFTNYGYARFKVYNCKLGATHYLTKYVIKDNYRSGWYDIKGLEYMDQLTFDKEI